MDRVPLYGRWGLVSETNPAYVSRKLDGISRRSS